MSVVVDVAWVGRVRVSYLRYCFSHGRGRTWVWMAYRAYREPAQPPG